VNIAPLKEPSARAPVQELADWLELSAILATGHNTSAQDLSSALSRSGSAEDLADEILDRQEPESDLLPFVENGDDDDDLDLLRPAPVTYQDEMPGDLADEPGMVSAGDAFSELEDRNLACSLNARTYYPFSVDGSLLRFRPNANRWIYVFLLLLNRLGHKRGNQPVGPVSIDTLDLFADICAAAATEYLGGCRHGADRYHFAFPRKRAPRQFRSALDDLCLRLGEGGGSKDGPTVRNQKDARLDLVVWKPFTDGRPGKFIGFGQCATGSNWKQKLLELQPRTFREQWMISGFAVDPVRLFFIPDTIALDDWPGHSLDGGIIFERCRLTSLASGQGSICRDCRTWCHHALKTWF
jgi:hypothetical protein